MIHTIAMVLVQVVLFRLIFGGGRALAPADRKVSGPRVAEWPAVAVIVPASGHHAMLEPCLHALLQQDYPSLSLIFVTAGPEDSASPVISRIIRHTASARMVYSGSSRVCGQKNHNLLAGLSEVYPETEVLVFCDSTRIAPAFWLKNLVGPIALGRAPVASGYHCVLPEEKSLAATVRTCTVLMMHMTRGFPRLVQPWGGNTAIRRELFEDLDVAGLWARNVVDDVSLAARLRQRGVAVASVPEACLTTPLVGESWCSWAKWTLRQWLYLKYCMPANWLGAGLACACISSMLVIALLSPLLAFAGWIGWAAVTPFALFLLATCVAGSRLSRFHPATVSPARWHTAWLITLLLAGGLHLSTLFTRTIHWNGITYRVAAGGTVRDMQRH